MPSAHPPLPPDSAQPKLRRYDSRAQADQAAAQAVATELRHVMAARGRASVVFASSLSETFFRELAQAASVEWTRVIVFHTDEVIGLAEDDLQSARRHLIKHLVSRVPIAEFHGLRGEAANPRAVCENYAAMLASRPPDLAVLSADQKGKLGSLDSSERGDTAKVKLVEREDGLPHLLSLTAQALTACTAFVVIAASENAARALQENPAGVLCNAQAKVSFFVSQTVAS